MIVINYNPDGTFTDETLDALHDAGKMLDLAYYQQRKLPPEVALEQQRNKIYERYRQQEAERQKLKELEAQIEKTIEKEAEKAIDEALTKLFKDFKFK